MAFDAQKVQQAVRLLLEAVDEDPRREGLIDTPTRVASMYADLLQGLHKDPRQCLEVVFTEGRDGLVVVRDIGFFSLCEHHLMPFFGVVHIGYLPRDGRVVGLSKLARVVERVARRLQLQERLTAEVADAMMGAALRPLGVVVWVEAEHLCMAMRGVQKVGTCTTTLVRRGTFAEDAEMMQEVLQLMRQLA